MADFPLVAHLDPDTLNRLETIRLAGDTIQAKAIADAAEVRGLVDADEA